MDETSEEDEQIRKENVEKLRSNNGRTIRVNDRIFSKLREWTKGIINKEVLIEFRNKSVKKRY